jgi:hypothetical protein
MPDISEMYIKAACYPIADYVGPTVVSISLFVRLSEHLLQLIAPNGLDNVDTRLLK